MRTGRLVAMPARRETTCVLNQFLPGSFGQSLGLVTSFLLASLEMGMSCWIEENQLTLRLLLRRATSIPTSSLAPATALAATAAAETVERLSRQRARSLLHQLLSRRKQRKPRSQQKVRVLLRASIAHSRDVHLRSLLSHVLIVSSAAAKLKAPAFYLASEKPDA